jgi:hypothetical protein
MRHNKPSIRVFIEEKRLGRASSHSATGFLQLPQAVHAAIDIISIIYLSGIPQRLYNLMRISITDFIATKIEINAA